MLYKNLSLTDKLWKIPFRISLDAISAWRGLLSGDFGYFIAILKAHLHFLHWFFLKRKQSVFPVKKDGTITGWYNGSVVWAYFIQKKKTFSEIIALK